MLSLWRPPPEELHKNFLAVKKVRARQTFYSQHIAAVLMYPPLSDLACEDARKYPERFWWQQNKFITISMMGETQNPNSFKLDTGIKGSVFSLSQGDCDVFLRKTFNPLAPEI